MGEQCGDAQLQIRDDGSADRAPGRRSRIVGQMNERCAVGDVRPMALDVIGEHRCSQHQNQVRALQARNDRRSIGRQKAGE